jgi:hypothetical protein
MNGGVVIKIIVQLLGNNTEQTANTYRLNACNKTLIKTSKPNLSN